MVIDALQRLTRWSAAALYFLGGCHEVFLPANGGHPTPARCQRRRCLYHGSTYPQMTAMESPRASSHSDGASTSMTYPCDPAHCQAESKSAHSDKCEAARRIPRHDLSEGCCCSNHMYLCILYLCILCVFNENPSGMLLQQPHVLRRVAAALSFLDAEARHGMCDPSGWARAGCCSSTWLLTRTHGPAVACGGCLKRQRKGHGCEGVGVVMMCHGRSRIHRSSHWRSTGLRKSRYHGYRGKPREDSTMVPLAVGSRKPTQSGGPDSGAPSSPSK